MSHVNKYLRNIKKYNLASHKVWEVTPEERKEILKLDWNESTLSPSPLVGERLKKLVESGDFFNLYPATKNQKLYQLLAKYSELPEKNVQYFASSDSLHEYIAKLFISVGDPVIILWPSYDNFRLTAEINGGHVYYFEYNSNFTFDAAKFKEFIKSKEASLVYICNPNNPTGYLHKPAFIKELIEEFPETMFLIDEAYFEFTRPLSTCSKLVLNHENILISRTMSKAFGIANFRFGYLLGSEENISRISSIRNPKNITTFAQEAACAVLEDVDYMRKYTDKVNDAKKVFLNNLKSLTQISAFDSQANFVVLRFKSFEEKMAVFNHLVEQNIYVRAIDQCPIVHECLRFTIGTEEQMLRVFNALKSFYGK